MPNCRPDMGREYGTLPDALVAGYRAAMPRAPVLDVYLAIFGDLLFGEYSNRLAEVHGQAGGRAYLSRFDRRRGGGEGNAEGEGVVRAWHCADIPFAFGNLDDDRLAFLIGGAPTSADRGLARRMVRAWADFAGTGDPGWPVVDNSGVHTKAWATDAHQAPDRPAAPRALWAEVGFPLRHA